jgi:GT2 family glycosyltransferase
VNDISRIAVLITCHNRAQLTLRCIKSLYSSNPSVEYLITIYLTDDGSTDETSKLIKTNFPNVTIIQGDGSLYWNRGMYSAWCRARIAEPDFYLLLNDDVELESDAILGLLNLYRKSVRNCVIVGKTVDPISKQTTYGALKRKNSISRNTFIPISAKSDIAFTFNANCVLIPAKAIESVGILDPFYTQQFGDIDLGLRLYFAGWEIMELEKPVAYLAKNSAYTHADFQFSFKGIKNILTDPKGIPIRELWHFLYKFNGIWAFFYFFFRYIRFLSLGFRNTFLK